VSFQEVVQRIAFVNRSNLVQAIDNEPRITKAVTIWLPQQAGCSNELVTLLRAQHFNQTGFADPRITKDDDWF
jgi:hypothetical protein